MGPFRAVRNLVNSFGIAWWARIETNNPATTYWFGPFLTRKSLKSKIPGFIDDLYCEGIESIDHSFVRCKRVEPLTF